MTLQIKLFLLALVAAAFLGLGWTAKYYHNKFVEVTSQLAAQKVTLDSALEAAKKCSQGTKALTEATAKKEEEVAIAQKTAEVKNAEKQANSNKILIREPILPDNLCKSAEDLFVQYKKDMVEQ